MKVDFELYSFNFGAIHVLSAPLPPPFLAEDSLCLFWWLSFVFFRKDVISQTPPLFKKKGRERGEEKEKRQDDIGS